MFAKEVELKLVDDLNENAVVELNAAEVDDVSGAIAPVVGGILIVGGVLVGAAAVGAGVGYAIGYWANRD